MSNQNEIWSETWLDIFLFHLDSVPLLGHQPV
jgi:hypothetical protein